MNSLLAYRFPEKEKIIRLGSFTEINFLSNPTGFIVSDFNSEKCYQFKLNKQVDIIDFDFHSNGEPYIMTPREYYLQAHEILNGINSFQMGKIVFSRIKQVSFESIKLTQLFDSLCVVYPKAFVYLLSDEKMGTWIGASPEILLEYHKPYVFTMALAGTKLEQDEWTTKEYEEQAMVSDFIQELFIKNELSEIEVSQRYEVNAGPVMHLKTDISAKCEPQKIHQLIRGIHPSPAVSGFPKIQACSLINAIEPHQRELYAGFIGEIQEDSCKLFVNLRCAKITHSCANLYLGGGFTKDSIPENEYIETENKAKTLLKIMQALK